jgi:Inorganic pyrophosphatase
MTSPEYTRKAIEHFFEHYKDLEPGKWVKTEGWGSRADAEAVIEAGYCCFPRALAQANTPVKEERVRVLRDHVLSRL